MWRLSAGERGTFGLRRQKPVFSQPRWCSHAFRAEHAHCDASVLHRKLHLPLLRFAGINTLGTCLISLVNISQTSCVVKNLLYDLHRLVLEECLKKIDLVPRLGELSQCIKSKPACTRVLLTSTQPSAT